MQIVEQKKTRSRYIFKYDSHIQMETHRKFKLHFFIVPYVSHIFLLFSLLSTEKKYET